MAELILQLAIFIAVLAGALYAGYKRVHRSPSTTNSPILLSYYTDGTDIIPLNQGKFEGLHYTALATMNTGQQIENPHGAAMLIRLELPFRTKVHLLGIPKNSGAMQLDPTGGIGLMEKIELEGDYPNYFSLYADTNQQSESRYVLDPKAMLFTVDFCQSHSWEIIRDELYFTQTSGGQVADDPTSMWDDVTQFVREIRPAIEDTSAPPKNLHQVPYGHDRRQDLKCPLCSQTMTNNDLYFICPNHDGILINGSNLQKLNHGEVDIAITRNTGKPPRHTDIPCPACQQQMSRTAFNGSTTIIDSCSNCPYRWLDAGEVM